MELTEVPDSLVVLGGGSVALELAQLFARLGSTVTMLVRSRLASKEEPEVSKALQEVFADECIRVVRRAVPPRVVRDTATTFTPFGQAVIAMLIRLGQVGQGSQNHLGRLAAMDVATAKGVVDRLKAKGLARSRPVPDERRRSVISLTTQGRALIDGLKQAGLEISAETLAPLDAAERQMLIRLLRKIA